MRIIIYNLFLNVCSTPLCMRPKHNMMWCGVVWYDAWRDKILFNDFLLQYWIWSVTRYHHVMCNQANAYIFPLPLFLYSLFTHTHIYPTYICIWSFCICDWTCIILYILNTCTIVFCNFKFSHLYFVIFYFLILHCQVWW